MRVRTGLQWSGHVFNRCWIATELVATMSAASAALPRAATADGKKERGSWCVAEFEYISIQHHQAHTHEDAPMLRREIDETTNRGGEEWSAPAGRVLVECPPSLAHTAHLLQPHRR